MVAETMPCLLLLLLLLLVAAGSGVQSNGEKKVVSLDELRRRRSSTPQTPVPKTPKSKNGAAVMLELRHQLYTKPESSSEDKLEMILISDEARIASLHSRIKGAAAAPWRSKANDVKGPSSDAARIPLSSGAKLQTLNYVATIELGSEKMTVIVDTGSELTWVQCEPCTSCYSQQDPLFDPSTSPTYRPIPCNSPACNRGCKQQSGCTYTVRYGDGSYTRGVLAREQINLGGTLVDGFVFGCGWSNRGLFGGASGLMGLGGRSSSSFSLVSQTLSQFGGVFSYCLPARLFDSSGSLVLGSTTQEYSNSTPVAYTRMIQDQTITSLYYLNMTGMSIGGVAVRASGLGNKILIDSGTVISRLVPSVYEAVRNEFLNQFSEYPVAPGFSILDTCFDLSKSPFPYSSSSLGHIPMVTLEFEGGVEVEVDVAGVLYFVKSDASQVCLALAQLPYEDQVGILGNYQQKNLRVVYDTEGSRLGFAQETCGYV